MKLETVLCVITRIHVFLLRTWKVSPGKSGPTFLWNTFNHIQQSKVYNLALIII